MRFEWGNGWGKPTDESDSRKFQNDIFEFLRAEVREHHPTLKKIKERERDVEKLATYFTDRWESLHKLESLHKEACDRDGYDSEHAKRCRAAMAWSEKRDEIDKLRKKIGYRSFKNIDPDDYAEKHPARSSIEWTIRDVMVTYNHDWDKDYEFRENLESFLRDIANQRHALREWLSPSNFDDDVYQNVGRYLENPSWHSPIITDFLLVDIFDVELLWLEKDFHFGFFPPDLANQMGGDFFAPVLDPKSQYSWKLPPESKERRWKWRTKYLSIGLIALYIWKGKWEGERITDLLLSNLPSWIPAIIIGIGISVGLRAILSILLEVLNRNTKVNKRVTEAAAKFALIRFEIAEQPYHAETLIERLKKLEDQYLVVNSLIYALLELRRKQGTPCET